MSKRRANGEGNIRKRKDGRWEGRYTAGYDVNGKAITKNVLGKTQAEVKDKLRAAIEDSKKLDPVKAGSYTLEQWLKLWYSVYVVSSSVSAFPASVFPLSNVAFAVSSSF